MDERKRGIHCSRGERPFEGYGWHGCLTWLSGPSNSFFQGHTPMSSNSKLAGALNLLPMSLLESAKTTICIDKEENEDEQCLFALLFVYFLFFSSRPWA